MIFDGTYQGYRLVNLGDVSGDGLYPAQPVRLSDGDPSELDIAIPGTFGPATVKIVFFTETDNAGTLSERPIPSQLSFTSEPEPQRYRFPKNTPFQVRVTGSDGTTDIAVILHPIQ